MNDKDFMLLAIKTAKKSKEVFKCGTVIVYKNQIIARSFNSQRIDFDASAHAEINAIRKAGKILKNKNLENCSVYSTCEPCAMCMSALVIAKVDELLYGASLKKVSQNINTKISTHTILNKSKHKFEIIPNFMEEECMKLYS